MSEHSRRPIARLKFKVTLEVDFKKNVTPFIKQTPKPVKLSPFELTERFVRRNCLGICIILLT